MASGQGWKNLGFSEKVFRFLGFLKVFLKVFKGFLQVFFRFFRFKCPNKTGYKIFTQEEHPIHNSLSFRAFSIKYNKIHK